MTGLRVAMLTPWRARCGVSDYSHHLVAGLRDLPEIAEVRIVEPPEDAVRSSALDALYGYRSDRARFRALGEQMNANADIAHVQHQYFFFGGVAPHKNHAHAFLDAAQIPLVMTVHEIARAASVVSLPARAVVQLANRANFLNPHIHAYIVHTGPDREALLALGVAAEKIHVVAHGIPSAAPMPDPDAAKQALGLAGKRVLSLFGFLAAKKGHLLALEALMHLSPDVMLLFAGEQHPDDHTEYVPLLREAIREKGLAERVRITGYLPEEQIPGLMAATDVALAPYLQSSGSGSLANLLAYGRAIVASDIIPHREIASEPPACLALFPSGDSAELAAQAQLLLDDGERRAALHQAALAYAARHSYAEMARETANIYHAVVNIAANERK